MGTRSCWDGKREAGGALCSSQILSRQEQLPLPHRPSPSPALSAMTHHGTGSMLPSSSQPSHFARGAAHVARDLARPRNETALLSIFSVTPGCCAIRRDGNGKSCPDYLRKTMVELITQNLIDKVPCEESKAASANCCVCGGGERRCSDALGWSDSDGIACKDYVISRCERSPFLKNQVLI